MRWSGQELDAEASDALPGLGRVSNLVRSVQTPEFAGITFHEVLAKSALNHVPAAEALPFGWTINPYRGCSHACTFCLDPETLILMGDGRQKPLWEVSVGDEIYGTERRGAYRRYVKTTVRAKWNTRKPAFRVTLRDGTEIVASGDHRFLTSRGWKHVTGSMSGAAQRPFLTLNDKLIGFGLNGLAQEAQPRYESADYRRGYLTGMIRGDGMIFHGRYEDPRGRTRVIHRFRLALTDSEALNRSRYFLEQENIPTLTRPYLTATAEHRSMTSIQTAREAGVAAVSSVIEWPEARSDEWHAGFLAGVFDAEGSCSDGILRISNKDERVLSQIQESLRALVVDHVREPERPNGVSCIRVTGGLQERQRFFGLTGPAISRKLDIEGRATKSTARLGIVSIEPLPGLTDLIDITTGTGDFVANGVVSHNCFARQTHTYLDFDAGKDFDDEIVVKVNVAEVLQKELARSSWGRHPVALGTNTDPYQRAEGRYRLMPGIIAALAAADTPFSILTKGTLLRRDLPLLRAAAERVPVDLSMSIAVYDTELQRSVEPGAPSTEARLATIAAARDSGFAPTVFLMPVLPYLTDSIAHLDRAFGAIAEAGAGSVVYSALHLRPGAREWYLEWLARTHPELVQIYDRMYGQSPYAPKDYRRWLAARIRPLLRAHDLDRAATAPATGAIRSRARGADGGVDRRPGSPATALDPSLTGTGLLAAELTPAAAAAMQPTLF